MAMAHIRPASEADVPAVAVCLAEAFHDDPVMTYLFPTEFRRPGKLKGFMAAETKRALHKGEVYIDEDRGAGAIWSSPGNWRMGGAELLGMIPALFRLGLQTPRALRLLTLVEKVHPTEPHWYLAVLGTRPEQQGHGLGSAVLAPVLARCDEEGLGAYLESSKESNIPFYRRHGFEVTTEVTPPGGPTLFPMWRDPR